MNEEQQKYKLILTQDGVEYDLGNLPKGFVIKGHVVLPRMKSLTILPDMSTVTVKGNFIICSGTGLKTLQGAPIRVEGHFICSENKLKTLKGAPQWVGGDFICSKNKLNTLEGGPQHVGGNYDCSFANLKSLKGAAEYVGGDFDCRGSREEAGSYYESGDVNNEYDDRDCENANLLKTLKGAPAYVGGTFNCAMNYITTLKGGPEYVGRDFLCFRNCLNSLKGLPKYCGGTVEYYDNNITDGSKVINSGTIINVKVLQEKTR